MRRLITRLDNELHARLKAQAAAEGRSVNSRVVDALTTVTSQTDISRGGALRAAACAGLLVVPSRPSKVPSLRQLLAPPTAPGRQ